MYIQVKCIFSKSHVFCFHLFVNGVSAVVCMSDQQCTACSFHVDLWKYSCDLSAMMSFKFCSLTYNRSLLIDCKIVLYFLDDIMPFQIVSYFLMLAARFAPFGTVLANPGVTQLVVAWY